MVHGLFWAMVHGPLYQNYYVAKPSLIFLPKVKGQWWIADGPVEFSRKIRFYLNWVSSEISSAKKMQWILAMIMPLLEKFGIKIGDLSPENISGFYHNPILIGFETVENTISLSWPADNGSLCKIRKRKRIWCSVYWIFARFNEFGKVPATCTTRDLLSRLWLFQQFRILQMFRRSDSRWSKRNVISPKDGFQSTFKMINNPSQ